MSVIKRGITVYLKFVRHVLLVERVETNKLETFAENVNRFVQLLGAQGDRVGTHLKAMF